MEYKEEKIEYLKERREVKVVDAEEGRRGAGEENSRLIDGVVDRVEGPVVGKGSGVQGEEEGWSHTLVDSVFGDVD